MPVRSYLQHTVHYEIYGDGPKLLLAWHGFADKGDLFEQLGAVFSVQYTLIAIDLPFHGQTQWHEAFYKPEDLHQVVQLLMNSYHFERCSMLCHSMGGRIILGLLDSMASSIDELYFVAAAGFKYTFSASKLWCPLWFRRRASRKFEHSGGVLQFFEWTHRLKLMNRATYLVFKQQLDTPQRRARLLKTWVAMYYFPMMAASKHTTLINQYAIKCYFFYGKKDRITPAKYSKKFVSKLKNAELTLFEGNHFFVRFQLAEQLEQYFAKKSQ